MSSFRRAPKATARTERFHAETKRLYRGRVRFVWEPRRGAGTAYGPGRWVMQELNRKTGEWTYVWCVEGPAGEPLRLGRWVHKQIMEMDRYAMGLAPKAAWQKFSTQMDSGRLHRARRREIEWDERREHIRDKAAFFFNDRITIPVNTIPLRVRPSERRRL